MEREELLFQIREAMREVGETPLSLACGNFTRIWYDGEAECACVKAVIAWDCDIVYFDHELSDNALLRIRADLAFDFPDYFT